MLCCFVFFLSLFGQVALLFLFLFCFSVRCFLLFVCSFFIIDYREYVFFVLLLFVFFLCWGRLPYCVFSLAWFGGKVALFGCLCFFGLCWGRVFYYDVCSLVRPCWGKVTHSINVLFLYFVFLRCSSILFFSGKLLYLFCGCSFFLGEGCPFLYFFSVGAGCSIVTFVICLYSFFLVEGCSIVFFFVGEGRFIVFIVRFIVFFLGKSAWHVSLFLVSLCVFLLPLLDKVALVLFCDVVCLWWGLFSCVSGILLLFFVGGNCSIVFFVLFFLLFILCSGRLPY